MWFIYLADGKEFNFLLLS